MKKRTKLVPQLNTIYYAKPGAHCWSNEFNEKPELKERELRQYRDCGLYASVDFYYMSPTSVNLKLELTVTGVGYYSGIDQGHGAISPLFFDTKFSTEPYKK